MTKNEKIKLAGKFLDWLEKSGCRVTVTRYNRLPGGIVIFDIVTLSKDGKPYDTLCYTTCEGRNRTDDECWAEILEKRCRGEMAFDRFDLIGLGKADTMEELALKLEIMSID